MTVHQRLSVGIALRLRQVFVRRGEADARGDRSAVPTLSRRERVSSLASRALIAAQPTAMTPVRARPVTHQPATVQRIVTMAGSRATSRSPRSATRGAGTPARTPVTVRKAPQSARHGVGRSLIHTSAFHQTSLTIVRRLLRAGVERRLSIGAAHPGTSRRAVSERAQRDVPATSTAHALLPLRLDVVDSGAATRGVAPGRAFTAQPQPLAAPQRQAQAEPFPMERIEKTLRESLTVVTERTVRRELDRTLRPGAPVTRRLRESIQSELYDDIVFERERRGER